MIINLSGLLKNEGGSITFDDTLKIQDIRLMGDVIGFPEPVRVFGRIENEGGFLRLTAKTTGKLKTGCGRCGKDLVRDFDFGIKEILLQEERAEEFKDEDAVVFAGTSLLLDDIAENNILLNLPIRYLCSEDCKGLCPKCGKDLNSGSCDCRHDEGDPRLSVLLKLVDK